MKAVQFLGVVSGLALVVVTWLMIRWLEPQDRSAALVAAALVAFLPLCLCVNPLVNNEVLAAVAISAVFLYMLVQFRRSWDSGLSARQALLLGLLAGLAMLSKFSAMFLVTAGVLALALRMLGSHGSIMRVPRSSDRVSASPPTPEHGRTRPWHLLPVFLLGVLLICGWYYGRNVALYGDPFYGNWQSDPDSQAPAYRFAAFYLRAGWVFFQHPEASQWSGFWDGLYASLWTGERMFFFADWMSRAMFLLGVILLPGLPLTAAMLIGLVHTAVSALARRDSAQRETDLLILSLTAWTVLALIWFSIRIPANGTVTARYLLYLVPTLALFLVRGRQALHEQSLWLRRLLDLNLAVVVMLVLYVYRFGIFRA